MRVLLTPKEQQIVDAIESTVKEEIDKLDPIGLINLGAPTNEYEGEIREITLRLYESANSFLRLSQLMYVIFAYKFDLTMAGPESKYLQAAQNIVKKISEKNNVG
jgi:hypothetical protein